MDRVGELQLDTIESALILVVYCDAATEKNIKEDLVTAVPSKGDDVMIVTRNGIVCGEVTLVVWYVSPMMKTQAHVYLSDIEMEPLEDFHVEYYARESGAE